MAVIELTDIEAGVRITAESRVLSQAAVAALGAPPLLDTQPWRWRIGGRAAELWADRTRQVRSVDPDGRLLSLACGVALHHAITALSAMGALFEITDQPDPGQPYLLARINLTGEHAPAPNDVRLFRAMANRRTEPRSFADRRVPEELLERLRAAAGRFHASLTFTRERPAHAVLLTGGDEPPDWVRAGEALSAVLLTATSEGLASDLVAIQSARSALRQVLGDIGYPMVVVRLGYRVAV
jgi:hypothetical protein